MTNGEHEFLTMVCGHVFRAEREVKLIIHHSDGEWQMVCGGHDHPDDCHDFENVGIQHIVQRQKNILEAIELPRGWLAELTPDGWSLAAHDD